VKYARFIVCPEKPVPVLLSNIPGYCSARQDKISSGPYDKALAKRTKLKTGKTENVRLKFTEKKKIEV
jgi:hypothetical protein